MAKEQVRALQEGEGNSGAEPMLVEEADTNLVTSRRNHEIEILNKQEEKIRYDAHHNQLFVLFMNGISTILIFATHLVSLESLVSVALSVSVTVYLYHETDEQSFDGSSLNWVLLTFAVVTPMITSVRLAFTRRENALASLARLRTHSIKLYGAHAGWDFGYNHDGTTGRSLSPVDWLDHSDQVLTTIMNILSDAIRYLTLPTCNRVRHRVTLRGKKEASETLSVSAKLFGNMIENVGKLCDYCEVLKKEGLPPQEAIRIRNWEVFILRELEVLRMIKRYRSPQALRSFGRLFSIFLPAFYAPYYVHISREVNSLGYGIAFACLTSLVLTSLFETVFQFEDPFLAVFDLDGIRVGQELYSNFLSKALETRKNAFPNAKREFRGGPNDVPFVNKKSVRREALGPRILRE